MRVRAHVASSAILSGILFSIFRSPSMVIGAFLSGILIDLDHILECYLNYGEKFNIWKTVDICEACKLRKAHLYLHSYELLFIFVLSIFLFKPGDFWYGAAAGSALHIILDSAFNGYYPNGLFFVSRWKVGFKASDIINKRLRKQRVNQRKSR